MKHMKTRELVLCALFVALITVGTFVRIPVGADVYTLQFLFTLLAGLLLGERLGALAVLVYIALGLLGVPVFASGGGPSYVLQPTFGFMLGFLPGAYLTGKPTLESFGQEAEILGWLKEFHFFIDDPITNEHHAPWDFYPEFWTHQDLLYDRNDWYKHEIFNSIPEYGEAVKKTEDRYGRAA